MEEANFLTRFAKEVTLIHRRDSFRSSKLMLQRVKENSKIKVLTNRKVVDWHGKYIYREVILPLLYTSGVLFHVECCIR